MKRTKVLFILIISMLIVSCGMSKPDIKKDYEGLSDIEKKIQYRYDKCCYNQQFTKIDMRCNDIMIESRKIQNILDYNTLKEKKKLPIIYRQSGNDIMTFDDYYKYVK